MRLATLALSPIDLSVSAVEKVSRSVRQAKRLRFNPFAGAV